MAYGGIWQKAVNLVTSFDRGACDAVAGFGGGGEAFGQRRGTDRSRCRIAEAYLRNVRASHYAYITWFTRRK